MGRAFCRHLANQRRYLTELRTRNDSEQHRNNDRKNNVSERPSSGNYDRIERSGGFADRFILFPFRTLHLGSSLGIDIRDGDISSERDRAYAPLDSIYQLFPEHGAKPDGKRLHPQSTPASGEKMTEFMNENSKRKQQHTCRYRQNSIQCFHKGCIIP